MASKITYKRIKVTGNTTVISENMPARGLIKAVYLEYEAGSDAGTDVLLEDNQGQEILDIDNNNTSGWYYPRTAAQDYQGTDLLFAAAGEIVPTEFVVFSLMKLTVAQNGTDKYVWAHIFIEEF